jgi:hypothetical protein
VRKNVADMKKMTLEYLEEEVTFLKANKADANATIKNIRVHNSIVKFVLVNQSMC